MKFFKPLGRLAAVTKPRARMLFVSFVLICWWITASIHRQAAHPRDFSFHDIHHPWNEISTFKDTPSTPLNASKLALIVEPRPLPVLVPLILHMIAVVPPDWRFLFIGSPWNIYSLGKSRSIRYQRDRGKIELMKLPKPWRLDLDEDVSRLLTDIRFYDEFIPDVEWVFKFEHDSILCANSPTSLDDWLSWSWAGMSRNSDGSKPLDTGGLSLRRTSVVRQILSFQERRNNSEPEDFWFGKRIAALPGETVASEFHGSISVDHVFRHPPIGYHVPDHGIRLGHASWKNDGLRKEVLEYCPELSMILDMKLGKDMWSSADRWESSSRNPIEPASKQHGTYAIQDETKEKNTLVKGLIHPPQPPPFPLMHS